jgi:hypothetical protein
MLISVPDVLASTIDGSSSVNVSVHVLTTVPPDVDHDQVLPLPGKQVYSLP